MNPYTMPFSLASASAASILFATSTRVTPNGIGPWFGRSSIVSATSCAAPFAPVRQKNRMPASPDKANRCLRSRHHLLIPPSQKSSHQAYCTNELSTASSYFLDADFAEQQLSICEHLPGA